MINKTQNPNYKVSEIDKVFYDLYNYYPKKEGQSYEILVGSVLKIIEPEKTIIWDEKKKGEFDENNYQIDVSIYNLDNESIMVEAKDHTKRKVKATRPELDKIAGTLIEINSEKGYFFSATDYTRDAKKKAIGSIKNPKAKNLSLYHLRKSEKSDEDNRIKTFILDIKFIDIDNSKTFISPIFNEDEIKILFPTIENQINFISELSFIHQDNVVEVYGNLSTETKKNLGNYYFKKTLSDSLFNLAANNDYNLKGEWIVDNGTFKINDKQIELKKIKYDIGFTETSLQNKITSKGNPMILVKSEDGEINKLITDNQLKGITISKNGELKFDDSHP